jgi:CRP/FNR family transcriptional regulator, cyclic AMP receptor protein
MNVRQVKTLPFLQGLSQPLLEEYSSYFRLFRVEKKNYVCHKGDDASELFFLLSGRLMMVDISVEGRQTGLGFVSPGDYFDELSVLDNLPRHASIIAVSESIIAALPKSKVNRLLNHAPQVAEKMLQDMCHRMRLVNDMRCLLSIPNARRRFYLLLSKMVNNQLYVDNFPSNQQVAVTINTTRETVSRAMSFLMHEGVVEKNNMRLVIKKPEELNRLVEDLVAS